MPAKRNSKREAVATAHMAAAPELQVMSSSGEAETGRPVDAGEPFAKKPKALDQLEPADDEAEEPADDLAACLATEGIAVPGCSRSALSHASADTHIDRRVMSAAATIGGTAGMLLVGPVSGAVLGAVAAYATTREDTAGMAARQAGNAYLRVADKATDAYIKAADRVIDKGCTQLSRELQAVASGSVPAPVRAGLQRLSKGLQPIAERGGASAAAGREEALRMRERYPDRVPIVCERSPYSDLPQIDRRKFAVPGTMLCGEFKYVVHKHVAQALGGGLRAEQTIYLFVNGVAPKTSAPMSELYEQLHADDGFLYIRYGAENTLG